MFVTKTAALAPGSMKQKDDMFSNSKEIITFNIILGKEECVCKAGFCPSSTTIFSTYRMSAYKRSWTYRKHECTQISKHKICPFLYFFCV